MAAKLYGHPKPAFCSGCFQQEEARYVEFDAAWDGPVYEDASGNKVSVDELVLCERCLTEAFAVLDPQGLKQEIARLEAELAAAKADDAAKDRIIAGFQMTTNELIDHPIGPAPGQRKVQGVPDEVAKQIKANRHARTKQKA